MGWSTARDLNSWESHLNFQVNRFDNSYRLFQWLRLKIRLPQVCVLISKNINLWEERGRSKSRLIEFTVQSWWIEKKIHFLSIIILCSKWGKICNICKSCWGHSGDNNDEVRFGQNYQRETLITVCHGNLILPCPRIDEWVPPHHRILTKKPDSRNVQLASLPNKDLFGTSLMWRSVFEF